VAVAFRFSHPVSSSRPHPAFRAAGSRASSWQLNILHVSTFTSKILRAVAQPRSNRFIDLAGQPTDACAILIRFSQLNPALSRFCVQLLSIQRFCACLRAKLMIPKDQRRRGICPGAWSPRPQPHAINSFAIYILPETPFNPKILLVFSRQPNDSKRSGEEGIPVRSDAQSNKERERLRAKS